MKIAFLLKNSGTEKSTAFLEVVKILTVRDVKIQIIIANRRVDYEEETYYCNNENVSVEVLKESADVLSEIEKVKNIIRKFSTLEKICGNAVALLQGLIFEKKRQKQADDKECAYHEFLTKEMREYVIAQDFDYLWAVDEYGLLWSKWINEHSKKKYKVIYHCLELYWEHYSLPKKKDWRYFKEYLLFEEARKALIEANHILIQDDARWKVLCKYTGMKENSKKIVLPVSIWDYDINSQNVLSSRLNIDPQKKVIFYPTLLAPKRGCVELTESTKGLPDDYITIIHGFSAIYGFVDRLRRKVTSASNLIISNVSFDYQELIAMHQDVWCVFLFYGEADNNDKYIANSSNKLAMSLQAGKPIITIGNAMLNQLCEECHCGVVLKDWSLKAMRAAIEKLENNYEQYCYDARKCYEERYDINIYAENVYQTLIKES